MYVYGNLGRMATLISLLSSHKLSLLFYYDYKEGIKNGLPTTCFMMATDITLYICRYDKDAKLRSVTANKCHQGFFKRDWLVLRDTEDRYFLFFY